MTKRCVGVKVGKEKQKKLIRVGFWDPPKKYPYATECVNKKWWDRRPESKAEFCNYLSHAGEVVKVYRGISLCRICGKGNGAAERSNGTHLWPSGLRHYVEYHDVLPPNIEFVRHVLASVGIKICQPVEHTCIAPGWGCCRCGGYSSTLREYCKFCGHRRCDV